ncbi:hypothetical protein [Olleya sp. 1-3]|uniref:hypothetical protein n=1 Tax=Olleya sp. 1-3 TaxID=2058323 RepID=UPI000C335171|nr:hypothetical protein [Olleya sp. 1-3]PKG52335.1 hypothetical protein CXF54_04500 [Olleya sp. 1-3]
MKNKNNKKKSHHQADIENPNLKTEGQNVTYAKNRKNTEKQLREHAEKKRLQEKKERDDRANRLNPNNPNYIAPKK